MDVAEASAGPLDLLDGQVRCLDGAVGGAGGVVGEDRCPPPSQRPGQGPQLGPGLGGGSQVMASSRRRVASATSSVRYTDLLLAGPCAAERVGGVAGGEGGTQSRPAGVVDAFGAEEQQLGDVVERVTLPAPVDAGVEGGGDEECRRLCGPIRLVMPAALAIRRTILAAASLVIRVASYPRNSGPSGGGD